MSFFDATFVALLALLIFVGLLVYLKVPKRVLAMLDARSAAISKELKDARELRLEAERLKAEYEAKRAAAEAEAAEIVAGAKEQARIVAHETRAQMKLEIERRTKQAEDMIARAEAQATAEVKAAAAEAAVAAAEKALRAELGAVQHALLVDRGVSELAGKFN
jgi:F-type H+-transporting ATPase subunit b